VGQLYLTRFLLSPITFPAFLPHLADDFSLFQQSCNATVRKVNTHIVVEIIAILRKRFTQHSSESNPRLALQRI
jgi:hypothetical protein